MRLSFADYTSRYLLPRTQGVSPIISAIVIGFIAGMVGSYLLANRRWAQLLALVSVAGIFFCLRRAVGLLLNENKSHPTSSAPAKKNVLSVESEWHYQPKETFRKRPIIDNADAAPSGLQRPMHLVVKENDVWCENSSESPPHPLVVLAPRGKVREVVTYSLH
jgi:hypothetical protein